MNKVINKVFNLIRFLILILFIGSVTAGVIRMDSPIIIGRIAICVVSYLITIVMEKAINFLED